MNYGLLAKFQVYFLPSLAVVSHAAWCVQRLWRWMKELIRLRVQYASRQQCCKTHKRHLPLPLHPMYQWRQWPWITGTIGSHPESEEARNMDGVQKGGMKKRKAGWKITHSRVQLTVWNVRLIYVIFNSSFPTSKNTVCVCVTKLISLMLLSRQRTFYGESARAKFVVHDTER